MKNLSEEERVSLRRSIQVIVDPVLDGVSELTKKKFLICLNDMVITMA